MSFLNILFLAGMAGLAGPILAHLLARPRYKRIPFTMMQFLEAGQMDSHRRRRIRNFLVLLLRCAIIACIVLGFAGPMTQEAVLANDKQPGYVIGFDDSLSMAYNGRLDELRSQLQGEMARWPAEARVDVVGMASGTRVQGVSPEIASQFLENLNAVPALVGLDGLAGALQSLGSNSRTAG
jgi:hypothetical protein